MKVYILGQTFPILESNHSNIIYNINTGCIEIKETEV